MNYYERHLGDYARDTAHLSLLEHGVYNLLLDRYYTAEQGIPEGQGYRLARARSREEKAAVDAVLEEFFELVDGVHINRRCEEEIAKFREKEPEREAKKENARERQRRARERRAELFEELRGHGIVPPYDTSTTELQAQLSRVLSRPVTPPVTRDVTATQTPDTRHQTPVTPDRSPTPERSLRGDDAPDGAGVGTSTPQGRAAAALNRAGVRVTSINPDLIAACGEGVTPDDLLELHRLYPDKPAAYLIAAARRQRAEGASPITGASHAAHPNRDRRSIADQVRMPPDERAREPFTVIEGSAARLPNR